MAAGGVLLVAAVAALAAWSYAAAPAGRRDAAAVVPHVCAAGARARRAQRQPRLTCARASTARTWQRRLRATGAGLVLELDDVQDGAHRVRVQASPSRVFGDSVDEAFTIHVDTRRPVAGARPGPPRAGCRRASSRARRAGLDARASPIRADGSSCTRAAARSTSTPKLPDGRTTVKLIASDRAGNRSVITRTFAVDRTAPRLHIDHVPAVLGTAHPTLRGSIDDSVAGDRPGAARRQRRSRCAVPTAPRCSARLRPRAASRCRSSISRRASTRSRSRPPTVPATPRPPRLARSRSTRPRSCAPQVSCRSARAAPTSCNSSAASRPSAPTTGPSRASTTRAPRLPCAASSARTTCPSRASRRPRCCSSARSASWCT